MANDRRLVTVDYLEEYAAGLNIPSVDQTYSPTSENAQSGKAVAEAVGEVKSDLTDLAEYAKTEVKGNLHHYYFGDGANKPIILANSQNTFVYPIKNGGTYIISIQGNRKVIGFANEEFETEGTLLSSFILDDFTYTFTNEADYKYLYVNTGSNDSDCVVYMKSNLVLQDSIDELKSNINMIAGNELTPYKTYENYYIASDGSLKGGESNTKVFIYPVVVGKTIELNNIFTEGVRSVYAYDSDLKPIKDITPKHIAKECSMTYTVEEGVYYVGCETKNEWNYSAKYTDYKTYIKDNLIDAMRYNDNVGNYCDNDFNLDARDLTAGGYISFSDGKTITENNSYYYSRYIEVKDNADILMQNCYAVEGVAFHCYDDEYNWIGRVDAGHFGGINNEIFTTLINTKYIRFSQYVEKINTFKLSYANELPKYYWADRIVRDWMSESHYKIQKLFKNATSKPIITFCDDDTATVESVTRYHDACERNGIKGCYAMLDCQLSKITELKDLLLSYERQGYHCVTHGYTQGSFYLNDSNRDLSLCEDDLIHSQQSFANYGFTDYKYWCTPYGVADDDIRNLAKKWGFKCAISSGNSDFNTSEEKLGRFALRRCTLNNNAEGLIEMKSRVDAAAACNGWLIITTHMAEEQWVSNQDVFDELVAYAKEKGMVPMTINQAWQLREPIYRLYEMF